MRHVQAAHEHATSPCSKDMQHGDMDMNGQSIAVCQIVLLFLQRQAQNTLARKKWTLHHMPASQNLLAAILYIQQQVKTRHCTVLSSNESNHLFFAAVLYCTVESRPRRW